MPDRAPPGLGIYVHWPYCLAKCPYCDFNSHVAERLDHKAWRRAYLDEIGHFAGRTGDAVVETIFFGGGTPSLMAPETVAEVISAVRAAWPVVDNLEITLEANPTSVEAARFQAFHDAGVNRVSVGVQALDDQSLAFLGRGHSAAEAVTAVELAGRIFSRFSFDLIYALPGQTAAAWARELDAALALAGPHLSLYQLTIEPGTPFHVAWRQQRLVPPDDDCQAALFELTQEKCAAAGLPAYEISNHARPGEESRHNLIYWQGGDYVGIGPGAHGRMTVAGRRHALAAHRRPERWLEAVSEAGHGTAEDASLSPAVSAREALMMGLRLTAGVALDRFGTETTAHLHKIVDTEKLKSLVDQRFLMIENDRLLTTPAGRLVLNRLLGELLLD